MNTMGIVASHNSMLQRMMRVLSLVTTVWVMTVLAQAVGLAQAPPFTTEFGPLRSQTYGVLYSPTLKGPESSVGLISMHPNGNRLTSLACAEFAQRGFRVLCINGQYTNSNRGTMIWERLPLDIKPAVNYLRQLPGIEKVVLLWGSGRSRW